MAKRERDVFFISHSRHCPKERVIEDVLRKRINGRGRKKRERKRRKNEKKRKKKERTRKKEKEREERVRKKKNRKSNKGMSPCCRILFFLFLPL